MSDVATLVLAVALAVFLLGDRMWTWHCAGRVLEDPRSGLTVRCEDGDRRGPATVLRDGSDLLFVSDRAWSARAPAAAFAPTGDGAWTAALVDSDGDLHRVTLSVRGQRARTALQTLVAAPAPAADPRHVRRAAARPLVLLALVASLTLAAAVVPAMPLVLGDEQAGIVDGRFAAALGVLGVVAAALAGLRYLALARRTSEHPEVLLTAA